MRIADSAIQLYSKNISLEQHQKQESLLVWQSGRAPRATEAGGDRGLQSDPQKEPKNSIQDQVFLSSLRDVKAELSSLSAQTKLMPLGYKHRQVQTADVDISEEDEMIGDLNMRILSAFFEKITGRKFHVIDPIKGTAPPAEQIVATPAAAETPRAGYGLVYEYHESHYEYEKTEFTAGGVITTADGRKIDFSVDLSMSREFYSEQNINIRAGDALKDPLVINFSGTAAQLSERNFSFDIDADGTSDQIAFVAPGSGFLALDKNNDGKINDGNELFGALSGNGFQDLGSYDDDGNNWIDENDAVYESLRIWSKDDVGNNQLIALGKAGVGALYLGHIETPFLVKDAENELLGQVRETGLTVMESGRVVSMQQIDLVA